MLWASGAILAVTGLALALSYAKRGKSDAAGSALETAYLAFGTLAWLVLAGLTGLGVWLRIRWLAGLPLVLVVLPLVLLAGEALVRFVRLLTSRMPTPALRRLERAARAGQGGRAKQLLAAGADVRDPAIGRALLRSAMKGKYARDVVNALLEAGADPHDPENLALAMDSNATDVLAFVKAGASPDAVLPNGDSLAFAAMKSGRMWVVEGLLQAGANPNQKDRDGWPLILAHASGKVGFSPGNWIYVRKMLDAGADPDVPGPDGSRVRDYFAKERSGIHPDHLEALRRLLVK